MTLTYSDTSRLKAGPADLFPALLVSAVALGLHLYTNIWAGYGYFRDELYYLVCADNLAWGYVDQPPFSIFILALIKSVFGQSVFAIRLLPALFHAGVVVCTGLIARELGARRFGITIAATAAAVSPIALGYTAIYSMNAIGMLVWALAFWLIARLLREPSARRWIALGIVLGIGLLNKIDVAWLGAGLLVGLLLTGYRRYLLSPWPWVAAVIALVIFSPYVIWNVTHDYAHLEFIRQASEGKYASQNVVTFLTGQLMQSNPVAVLLWLAGLAWLLLWSIQFRPLGLIFLTALAILLLNVHSKPEYLAAAYPVLFAAGGRVLGKLARKRNWGILIGSYTALIGITGLLFAPLALPILPEATYVRYAQTLGIGPSTSEGKALGELPQFFADMHGWPEKAQAVADVYHALPSADKLDCAIFADNYGRSAAIDVFGRALGLPRAIGRHNNYWLWGPRDYNGKTVIVLGGNLADQQATFDSVEVAGVVTCDWCMPYEDSLSIYIGRNVRIPVEELWPQLKHFD